MSLVDALGWLAAVVGIVLGLPQLVRLIRVRHTEGVSLLAWQTLLILNLSWGIHGVLIGQLNMILTNVFGLLTTVPILVLMARSRRRSLVLVLLPGVIGAAVVVGADLIFGTAGFGMIALVPGTVVNVAQSLELVRSAEITGVSATFLLLAVVNQALWCTWAIFVPDLGTLIAAGVAVVITSFNLVWWGLRRLGLRALFVAAEREPADDPIAGPVGVTGTAVDPL